MSVLLAKMAKSKVYLILMKFDSTVNATPFLTISHLVVKLFLMSVKTSNPVVMENITLPCLRILHHLVKPPQPTSKKNKVAATSEEDH